MAGSYLPIQWAGQRVSQEVSSIVTQYLLDTQPGLYKVLAATAGTDTTRFVHGSIGIHAQENPDGDWLWMVQDGLGSITGVVDDVLSLLENRQYAPYGEVWEQNGTEQTNYQFTGEWVDQNDLLYLRARYLNPTVGTFISLDPLETANRYGYAHGNPVMLTDPTGLSPLCEPQKQETNTCASQQSLDAVFDKFGVSLFPSAQQSNRENCWTTDMVLKVNEAFNQVDAKIPQGFRAAFNRLRFEVVASGVDYGLTVGTGLVQWRRSGTVGIDAENNPDEFRKTVAHELGHVLVNRTSGANRANPQGMWNVAFGTSQSIMIGDQLDISSMPGKGGSGDIERIADAFMFWVNNALDKGIRSDAVKTYMEGGIIVWDRLSDTYPYLIMADNANFTPGNIIAAAEFAEKYDPEGYVEITISPGIRNWIDLIN